VSKRLNELCAVILRQALLYF